MQMLFLCGDSSDAKGLYGNELYFLDYIPQEWWCLARTQVECWTHHDKICPPKFFWVLSNYESTPLYTIKVYVPPKDIEKE